MACQTKDEFVEEGVDRVKTALREAPKFLIMLRSWLGQLWDAQNAVCGIPEKFDIASATGEQLTIIGKWLGFPRCHCVCSVQPVFGFACDVQVPGSRPIVGFCEGGVWLECATDGISEICITDDEVYRSLLIARGYQVESRYSEDDLNAALRAIFGPQARVVASGHGQVVLAPLRVLTDLETAILQIIPRVLPVAPGIVTRWHFGTFKIAGFGEGWGGLCEEWEPDGLPLVTEDGIELVTEDGEPIFTGPLTRGADWLCQQGVKPYSC